MYKAHSQSSTDETGSLFSFASDFSAKGYNLTKTISMSRSRSIYGHTSGTFENVASEEDSVNDKVIDTYSTYQMDQHILIRPFDVFPLCCPCTMKRVVLVRIL